MIIAFHDPEKPKRQEQVQDYLKSQHLGKPDQWFDDYATAFCYVLEITRAEKVKGSEVTVVGFADDATPPYDVNNEAGPQWGMAGKYLLDKAGIELILIDQDSKSQVVQTIADYQHSLYVLEDRFSDHCKAKTREAAKKKGYTVGRPPFGYVVVDGKLVINWGQAKLVQEVFQSVNMQKKFSIEGVAAGMKARYSDQNWDRKKVSRILAHAALYHGGRYVNKAKGIDVVLPGLAILQPSSKP